jgi:hypothetical protein
MGYSSFPARRSLYLPADVADEVAHGGRVNVFEARFRKLVEITCQRYGLEDPEFLGLAANGDELAGTRLPSCYIVFEGQPMGNSWQTSRLHRGRLILYMQNKIQDGDRTEAKQYLRALDEAINIMIRENRNYLEIGVQMAQTATMSIKRATTSAGMITLAELRREYAVTIG